ncbi:MAG: helix-turn-helix domain-containing protein [Christensenella sp.]|nr:helix-turn-helix domain-containing protein [Christensenella sp.]
MIRKEFIVSELKYRFLQVEHSIQHPEQAVNRPLFFENSGRRFSARIIVCTADELNELEDTDQPAPLFLCIGQPDLHVFEHLDLCIFSESVNPLALFNFVQRLFDRLDEWRQRLKEIAETSADVALLLDGAAGMLQNPLWLCDAKCHVISEAERYSAERKQLDLSESYKLLEEFIHQPSKSETDILRLPGNGGPELAVSRITASGARFALICAASERAFYGSDEVVFEHLSGYVKLMLSERKLSIRALRQRPENEQIEPLLRVLFEQSQPDTAAIDALASFGWHSGESYCVVAAEPSDGDMRAARLHTLCDRIETTFPVCCAFSLSPFIAAVIRSEGADIAKTVHLLQELGSREGIRFGVCESVSGLFELSNRFSLAKYVLSCVSALPVHAAAFSDVAEAYFCERGVSEFSADLVCLRSVLNMAAYDREHDTNYIETADRYVKNRFNAVKTANELFIHRSTFLYRLERIKAQFGLDLEAELTTPLHLFLSLQYMKKEKPDHAK